MVSKSSSAVTKLLAEKINLINPVDMFKKGAKIKIREEIAYQTIEGLKVGNTRIGDLGSIGHIHHVRRTNDELLVGLELGMRGLSRPLWTPSMLIMLDPYLVGTLVKVLPGLQRDKRYEHITNNPYMDRPESIGIIKEIRPDVTGHMGHLVDFGDTTLWYSASMIRPLTKLEQMTLLLSEPSLPGDRVTELLRNLMGVKDAKNLWMGTIQRFQAIQSHLSNLRESLRSSGLPSQNIAKCLFCGPGCRKCDYNDKMGGCDRYSDYGSLAREVGEAGDLVEKLIEGLGRQL